MRTPAGTVPDQVVETAVVSPGGVIPPLRLINPDGSLTETGTAYGADLERLRGFYRDMLLSRRFDAEALALQRQGELALWLMNTGQEAAQVGSVRALRDSDWVFPSYRDHAAALARGITPAELLAQWRGCSHGGWDPARYRFHINTLVLGTQTLHATGYALGIQRDGADDVVLTYFGDGAASQGDVNEALNWAAVMRAPIIFFCQNNHWAISTPVHAQSAAPLYRRAAGFGLRSSVVDGNDVLAVHLATVDAVRHVRAGGGPAFIEAVTYRMAGHSTSDDPKRYRDDEEVRHWEERDPLIRVRTLLTRMGTPESFFERADRDADLLAKQVRAACLALPEPNLFDLFDHVYAEDHPIRRQAQEHAAFLRTLQESPA